MPNSVRILLSFIFVIVLMTITGIFGRGVQAADQPYNQATASWQGQNGAAGYNVYYKESGMTTWKHSVRDLPSNASSITIGYLKPGITYWYRVSAKDLAGKEFWWSSEMSLNPMKSTTRMPSQTPWVPSTPQASAPTTTQNGSWTSATIHWVPDGNAQHYNIYYKETGQSGYMYSVPNVPNNASTLTISGLKSTAKYLYNVAAYYNGKEYWMGEKVLSWGAPKVEVVSLSTNIILPDPTTMVPPTMVPPTNGTIGNPNTINQGQPQQLPQIPATNDSTNDSGLPTNPQGNAPVYKY